MAHLDNLIEAITDPVLRSAIQGEYKKILDNRQFGLVFNAHRPESILLPGFTLRRGDKVRVVKQGSKDRTDVDDSGVWIVAQVVGDSVIVSSKSDQLIRQQLPKTRVIATREFGDPIYPGLRSCGKVELGSPDEPWHTVINSENYHALQALLYPYEERVDAIYIDPPYNTGARDWRYNNDYVDTNDPYRHSKWLAFMERRLKVAKKLLNPKDSVLIVTIDEKEYLRLGMLLEQTFPEARIQMVSSIINPAGSTRTGAFSRTDEYLFIAMFGAAKVQAVELSDDWRLNPADKRTTKMLWAMLKRNGTGNRREDRPSMFYPIMVAEDGSRITSIGDSLPLGVDRNTVVAPAGSVACLPINSDDTKSDGRWQIGQDNLRELIKQGFVRIGRASAQHGYTLSYLKAAEQQKVADGTYEITGHRADGSVTSDSENQVFIPGTVWRVPSHDSSRHGSNLLKLLMPDRKFPFPKSLYAVEDVLRFFVGSKNDALVLDFFAGSGTTTHAVMRLNHQDGGKRRSICVTNNEVGPDDQKTLRKIGLQPSDPQWESLGICRYFTEPRIRAAVSGIATDGEPIKGQYRFVDEFDMADGFKANVEFFDLTYQDPSLVSLGRKFHAVAPLLWLKAGAQGARIEEVSPTGWALPEAALYGVLFDTLHWSDFVDAVNARYESGENLVRAFIVTDSGAEYRQIVAKLDRSLATTRLYADYLRTFEINTTGEE